MVDLPNRHDHFAAMRQEPVEEKPPADAPRFSTEQYDYLDALFGSEAQLAILREAGGWDTSAERRLGQGEGYAKMLKHILTLTTSA